MLSFRVIYLCFTFYVFYENVKKNHFFRYHFRKKFLRFLFFIYVYVQFHILRFFFTFFYFTFFYVILCLRFFTFFIFFYVFIYETERKHKIDLCILRLRFFLRKRKKKCKKCIYVNDACAWFSGEGHRS